MLSQIVLSLLSVSVLAQSSSATVRASSAVVVASATASSASATPAPPTAATFTSECLALIKLNTKLSTCGSQVNDLLFGASSVGISSVSALGAFDKDLPAFCSSDCALAFPKLAADIQSTACASTIEASFGSVLSGKDAGTILTFLHPFMCLKDGANYCPLLSVSSGSTTTTKTDCTKCSALQIPAMNALLPTLSSTLATLLGPSLSEASAAQAKCPSIASSAMGNEGAAILAAAVAGAALMF